MSCECDGSGWVRFVAEFKTRSGKVHQDIEQVKRCPGYFEYFRASPLIRDYPEKTPPRDYEGACRAAVSAHRDLWAKNEQSRKSDEGPKI